MKANAFKKATQAFKFIPNNGVRHGDLKRYWDNYNAQLINRISEIRNYEKI